MDPLSATSAMRFLPLSAAVADESGPGPLHHVARTGSTNADLAADARRGGSGGLVLVADHQTAGRGRLGRRWEDRNGSALLASLRVPLSEETAGAAVRALGAAARAAVDALCSVPVLAKWPNDLVVVADPAPGKLAGVLAEFVAEPSPCVIIGIGINLAPMPGRPEATSIVECGGSDDRDGLLAALLQGFADRLRDPAGVSAELRTASATLGSRVRVEYPGGRDLVGLAVDLADDGRLVIDDDDGARHVVDAGDVVHLRPA